MSLIYVGLSHRSAPLDLLERMTVSDDYLAKALHDLRSRPHITEAVVLSTCNRTEVYAVAEKFHGAYADVRDFLAEHLGIAPEEFTPYLVTAHDADAVSHLFGVTSGLDSMVIGESEIQGQVKRAWEHAKEEGGSGPILNLLFRHALATGKRARTETAIGRSITSMSHAAVAMADERLGGLHDRRVVVIGAGDMGAGLVGALAHAGASNITIANRTVARAHAVASLHGATSIPLSDLPVAMAKADLVVSATAADEVMITAAHVAGARADVRHPLLMIDIAMPRDIDAAVAMLPGVTLLDMRHVQEFVDTGLRSRHAEVDAVREIIDVELENYLADSTTRRAGPLVRSLHGAGEDIRQAEIAKAAAKLDGLTPAQRNAVEAITKGIVAKLLHTPTNQVKEAAGSPRGDRLAEALRELFDL